MHLLWEFEVSKLDKKFLYKEFYKVLKRYTWESGKRPLEIMDDSCDTLFFLLLEHSLLKIKMVLGADQDIEEIKTTLKECFVNSVDNHIEQGMEILEKSMSKIKTKGTK